MTLYEKITADLKNAMINKDKDKLSTIRLLKGAVDLKRINEHLDEITDEIVIDVASKQVKTHKESIVEFNKANRKDLSDKLDAEIKILSEYLPKQLTVEEIEKEIDKIISSLGATSKSDLGKVMKEASSLKGKADFKIVSEIVQSKLK